MWIFELRGRPALAQSHTQALALAGDVRRLFCVEVEYRLKSHDLKILASHVKWLEVLRYLHERERRSEAALRIAEWVFFHLTRPGGLLYRRAERSFISSQERLAQVRKLGDSSVAPLNKTGATPG